ncbi:GNAT family N-acetyltransferase [Actinoplanes awajinensis]|uniref:Acetyltransferase n=1 Tax=Actinoplanes awajinensis subsp. mycoplanecinus TaxID=135947 RepID=A0A101JNT2_9ACTN|nr:GNAT family N-acetyltransferase [Actinoplanes awajinensis]KUL30199.1 acetyltransferase [Actinoplanes awajinensis subsp. mycoplanecinus]
MAWQLTSDVEEFAAVTGEFLRSAPVRHTVFLTLVDTLRSRGPHAYGPEDPFFGWWTTPGAAIRGVLLQTPPHPVLFSELPADAVPAAVTALADRPIAGVNMLAGDIPRFAGDRPYVAGMRTRLHRLGALTPPEPAPPGVARPATAADRDLLVDWFAGFDAFIGNRGPGIDTIEYSRVTLWTDDGVPVAMAVRSRPQAGMVRILTVWTPPELRRRGYAGGATAAATRAALDEGASEVVLYTDLANPTSNALYHRLGYRPVEDRAMVEFR